MLWLDYGRTGGPGRGVGALSRSTVTGWRLDDRGRLIAPGGAFVARIVGRKIVFYDKRRGCELPGFSMIEWLQLVDGEDENAPAERSAGAWGR